MPRIAYPSADERNARFGLAVERRMLIRHGCPAQRRTDAWQVLGAESPLQVMLFSPYDDGVDERHGVD